MVRYLSIAINGWISSACSASVAALAMLADSGGAQAHTGGQIPSQICLQKTNHTGDLIKLAAELPSPAKGKLRHREIQTSGPRNSQLYSIDDPILVQLPLSVPLGTSSKITAIPLAQTLVFSEAATNGILRVSCDAENIYFTGKLAVSAAGYLTDNNSK